MDLDLIDKHLRRLISLRRELTTYKAVDLNKDKDRKDHVGENWQVRNSNNFCLYLDNEEDAKDLSERLNKANVPIFEAEQEEFQRFLREQVDREDSKCASS